MKDKIVKEWFERGEHDFETAKLIFSHEGYYDEVLFLLHQAVEKYLKGFLIFHGWGLKKIHDIETLLTEAMDYDKSYEEFLDLGRKLTAFYYENRYPPGPLPEISKVDVEHSINRTEEIITKIRAAIGI